MRTALQTAAALLGASGLVVVAFADDRLHGYGALAGVAGFVLLYVASDG
jgi:hypothetical protein